MKAKKSLAQKLGLKRLDKLSKKACLERAKYLKKMIAKGVYSGPLLAKAKGHQYWYTSKARALKSA